MFNIVILNYVFPFKEIIRKALPIIASILEKESRGWFLPFREKIISDLKSEFSAFFNHVI